MRIDEILQRDEPCLSVEFFPPKTEEGRESLFETVDVLRELNPAFYSVTYGAGGSTREGTVEISREIQREHGVEVMTHLSCVGETVEKLREILDQVAEAGIENVLALRGDPPRGEENFLPPEGGLKSSDELAALISEHYPGIAIGGACFPEVHPEAESLEADLAFLKKKVEAGASFLITQLFFDNRLYFDFVDAARGAGIEVPIIPGVMPMSRFSQISRICDLCDASIPRPLESAMAELGGGESAEFELGVAWASAQCAELLRCGAPGIHFYALNRYPATRAILSTLRAMRPWEQASAEPEAVTAP